MFAEEHQPEQNTLVSTWLVTFADVIALMLAFFVMLFSLILVSGLIIIGSVQPGFAGGRYAVVPGVILIFIVFRFFLIENNFVLKNLFFLLLISSLIIGSLEYRYFSPLPHTLQCTDNKLN